jgi:hypothetical protein
MNTLLGFARHHPTAALGDAIGLGALIVGLFVVAV